MGRSQAHEDVLAAPGQRLDAHAGDRLDEFLRLGVANDRRKRELAADDRATDQVRPQVSYDRLDLWELRHPASGERREIRRRGGPDAGEATSNAASASR